MSYADHNRTELQPEVALRVARLSEEVRSRLLEIALIVSRTTGTSSPNSAHIKFAPRIVANDAGANAGSGDWVEIIEVDGVEACYGVIDGIPFAESPCGG